MERSKSYRDLIAWKKSIDLVGKIYSFTRSFPKEEIYGLTSQIRRAAVSIPSNIAEGAGRSGHREFVQFLSIARGSLSELETQLLIAADLGYMDTKHRAFEILERVSRLMTGLHKKLSR